MDFRETTIDLGGKPATAPGAGGSGGGAIGPGARGGDGGPGGDRYEFTVTGAQVLSEIPIEVGHAGRGGVDGLPGEAGGHTRFGAIVTPGGGRKTHSPFPEALAETVTTSVSSAVLANYIEINNGLCYLSGAGWASYNVAKLPGPFRGALCVWIDLSWTDAQPGTEIPLEVIVELITPIKTATFSEMNSAIFTPAERTGVDRMPFVFSLIGTLHDAGLHILNVSCNTGLALVSTSTSASNLRPKNQPCDLTCLNTASNMRCLAHANAPSHRDKAVDARSCRPACARRRTLLPLCARLPARQRAALSASSALVNANSCDDSRFRCRRSSGERVSRIAPTEYACRSVPQESVRAPGRSRQHCGLVTVLRTSLRPKRNLPAAQTPCSYTFSREMQCSWRLGRDGLQFSGS
jgi:hypothetical protein